MALGHGLETERESPIWKGGRQGKKKRKKKEKGGRNKSQRGMLDVLKPVHSLPGGEEQREKKEQTVKGQRN